MIRIMPRRSRDVRYYTEDQARELDGLRPSAGWWLRGDGDASDPDRVAGVLGSSPRARVLGYDIIVAAPRPVSVLLALDESAGAGLVRAHRESVAAALRYLEDRALSVRVRRGGMNAQWSARWESVVSFTHGVNRHGDPHLHDHVLVGARPEGEDTVVDARSLRANQVAADALYRAHLRVELARRTGWVAWRSFGGLEAVTGVDEGYRTLWGGHHDERGTKRHYSREAARSEWARALSRYQPEAEVVPPSRALDVHAFAAAFEGLTRITRSHVVASWADAQVFGARADRIESGVDVALPELIASRGLEGPSVGITRVRSLDLEGWHERERARQRSRVREDSRSLRER